MKILDGQILADQISQKLAKQVKVLAKKNLIPALHIYLIGDNLASLAYVNVKQKKARELGVKCVVKKYPASANIDSVIMAIKKDNINPKCHGIIVQLPLPTKLDPNQLLQVINPDKDVDGLTYLNQWKMMYGMAGGFLPATAQGILTMLEHYQIPIAGQNVVVIGRSRLVGLPTSLLLLQKNATITICHSHTRHLAKISSQADILVIAVGQPKMVTAPYVKKNAIVIDVGISRQASGELIGDVDFSAVKNQVKAISPVPKGVGPMTVITLFSNLLQAATRLLP
ncbi:MAG: tetrahydrofolate dehydrogenase/cyclohydrolase catalytic domain-containing protein [Patescibacteria group bacterium]